MGNAGPGGKGPAGTPAGCRSPGRVDLDPAEVAGAADGYW